MPFKRSTWDSSPPKFHTPINPLKANRAKELKAIAKQLGFDELSPMQSYMHRVFTEKKSQKDDNSPENEPQYKRFLLLVPRQTGKTEAVAAPVVVDRLINYRDQVILWSAQTADMVIRVFNTKIIPMLRKSGLYDELGMKWRPSFPDPALYVEATNSYVLILTNSENSGRGLSTNLLIMDEVRALANTDRDEAIIPSLISNPDGQVLFTSTAGNHKSLYLMQKADAGRLAVTKPSRFGFAEWRADEDDDFFSDKVLIQANPSLGYSATLDALKDERDMYADEGNIVGFAAEYLNVWKEQGHEMAIPIDLFKECETPRMSIDDFGPRPVLAIHIESEEVTDLASFAIAGNGHVSLEATNIPIDKTFKAVREIQKQYPQFRTIAVKSFGRLEHKLSRFYPGYPIERKYYTTANLKTACARFLNDIIAGPDKIKIKTSGGRLRTCLQAISKNTTKTSDLFMWEKEVKDINIAPLWAITMAHNESCWKEGRGVPSVRVFNYGGGSTAG